MDAADANSPSTIAGIAPLDPQPPEETRRGTSEQLESTGDTIMKDPAPSPPPSVAGTKREMVGRKAYALDNVKVAKTNEMVRNLFISTALVSSRCASGSSSSSRVREFRVLHVTETPSASELHGPNAYLFIFHIQSSRSSPAACKKPPIISTCGSFIPCFIHPR